MIKTQILFWKTIEGSRRLRVRVRVWVRFILFYSELAPHWPVMYVTCSLYLDEKNIRRQCQMSNVTWNCAYVSRYCKQDFCTKTRLCNIFKNTEAKTLIKAILKSPYKVLQTPWKNNYPNTAHTLFTGRSIFSYLQKQLNYSLF